MLKGCAKAVVTGAGSWLLRISCQQSFVPAVTL